MSTLQPPGPARDPEREISARRWGWLLAAIGGVTFLVLLAIVVQTISNTRDLGRQIEETNSIVDANIRTVTQAQREVLRLEVDLVAGRSEQVDLGIALVSQRAQESALPFQQQALGTVELAVAARQARRLWEQTVLPAVERYRADPTAANLSVALSGLRSLELRYNDIARDGANNRKLTAARATDSATRLFADTKRLLAAIIASLAIGMLSLAGAVLALRRIAAIRQNHERELVGMNAERERLAEVVKTTSALVARATPDGRLVWVNDATLDLFGVSLEQIADVRVPDLPHEVLAPADAPTLVESLAAGMTFTADIRTVVDGVDYFLRVNASPTLDPAGAHVGWNVVASDIADEILNARLREEARLAAEQLADEKSRFLATMSHEIRTPLNAVIGLHDVLVAGELDAEQRVQVEQARVSARHLLDLVNDVLDFSALDAGRMGNVPSACDLRALLDGILTLFAVEADGRGLSLTVEVAQDVPAVVTLDETHIRRILVNVLGNALKYTTAGGVDLRLTWDGTVGAERLRIEVADTGVGIDPAEVESLFEPFSRSAATRASTAGTGLGLWICRRVLDLIGGSIHLEPRPGGGTLVVVDYPVRPGGSGEATPSEPAVPITMTGLKVLVADDDDINRFVLGSLLRQLGIVPVLVEGGEQAQQAIVAGNFDVALLDRRMPGVDGVAVVQHVIAAAPTQRPRLIAVTADALPGDREELLAAGFDDYLPKPVTLDALRLLLSRGLRNGVGA